MSDDYGTPLGHNKAPLRYVDRLQEIKRAICTLDESLTPSRMVGNKSIALSPIFNTPYKASKDSSLQLLDHNSILTPSRTRGEHVATARGEHMENKENTTFLDTFLNSEVVDDANKIKSTEALINNFYSLYKMNGVDDVLGVMGELGERCGDLHATCKGLLPSVKHSKKLSHQISSSCKQLLSEKHTWKLLCSVYSNKLSERSLLNDDEMSEGDSHVKTIDRLYNSDEHVMHVHTVLDWLQSNAAEELEDMPNKVGYFSGRVSWEHTFHSLTNNQSKKLVRSMDPDAVSRENLPLHEVDLEDQSRLIKHVFQLIRAGKVDEAQKLCIKAGQFWRAAALEGWRLHHDPNYQSNQREMVEGNVNRGLWKSCCWQYCSTSHVTPEEKAMYGALCGNLQALLPQCPTFQDKLWAYLKVLLDQQVESELADDTLPPAYWRSTLSLESVTSLLSKTKGYNEVFNKIQLQIINHDINGVVSTVNDNIDNASISMARFLCHLMLVLEVLHPDCGSDTLYKTLVTYIKLLKEEGHMEEVLYYTTHLPTSQQIQLLSQVLAGVQGDTRQFCVEFAVECNIPIKEVAKNIYDNVLASYTPDLVSEGVNNISDQDSELISALSWLLLLPSQRSTALIEANRLMRRFINARKHPPAAKVFSVLPGDTIDVVNKEWAEVYDVSLGDEETNAIREYLCLQAYLESHQAYNDWCSHAAKRPDPPPANKDGSLTFSERVAADEKQKSYEMSLHRWEQNLILQTQLTRDKMLNVLLFIDGGWLIDEAECSDQLRNEQLSSLRAQCIPATTFLLVNVLMESGQYSAVVELSEYIASEQYKLYDNFTKQELRQFLDSVYECSLMMNCDPLSFKEESSEVV